MATKAPKTDLDANTVRIARTLLNTPPKPHDEMKVEKSKRGSKKTPMARAIKGKR
jgi:hypothetical protein